MKEAKGMKELVSDCVKTETADFPFERLQVHELLASNATDVAPTARASTLLNAIDTLDRLEI